jgi:spermidine/putrescine transport system permease protein
LIRLLKKIYLAVMLLFMYAPIAVLIVYSFNASRSRSVWGGFTLDWYAQLLRDKSIQRALSTTLSLAFLSALLATIIGAAAAVGIHSMRGAFKKTVLAVTNIPVIMPDIVMGLSLLVLYTYLFHFFPGIKLGYGTLLVSHTTFNIPYVILSVLPKLKQLDPNLYEAALDLGCTPIKGFFKVVLQEITSAIVTGAMLAFTMSLDDFIVSYFTKGDGDNTLSTIIYSMARRGVNPKINALSAIMFVAVLLLLYVINSFDPSKAQKANGLGLEGES